jgi:peptidoglycan/LPS O-acetylase OafA/YrhL
MGTIAALVANRLVFAGKSVVNPDILLAFVCGLWVMCGYWGLPRLIDNRISRFLGRISYGQYLVHPFVLWVLSKLGLYEAISSRVQNSYVAFLVCALVSIPIVVLFAELAYRAVEAPGIALGESLLRSKKVQEATVTS